MTLLHTMSLAGSIATGMYLCAFCLTKRYLPITWHKIYLTANILLFLIPFGYFKPDYTAWLNRYLGLKAWYQRMPAEKNLTNFTVFVYQNGVYVSNLHTYIILSISLFLGFGGLILYLKKYFTVYLNIMKGAVLFERGETVLKKLEEETKGGFTKHIKCGVYLCAGIKTPVAIGIVKRKIILPGIEWEEKKLRDVLGHELVHIRAMDNLVKIILFLTAVLNFYNPLAYYLVYRWNLTAEMYCDYKVTMKKSLQEVGDYAKMIIDFAEKKGAAGLPAVGFSLNGKQIQERILNMKNTRKKYGKISSIAGMLMLAAAVFASSLTVYAYEKRQIQYFDEPYEKPDKFALYSSLEDAVSHNETNVKYREYEQYITSDNITFFVTETGEVHYDVHTGYGGYQIYASCSHIYTSGTLLKHTNKSGGGCVIDYYNGKRCNKCGHTVYGNHVQALSYDACPH